MIRACVLLALATSALAGYTGYGLGYGLGYGGFGYGGPRLRRPRLWPRLRPWLRWLRSICGHRCPCPSSHHCRPRCPSRRRLPRCPSCDHRRPRCPCCG
ncbi:hypothetical protein V5799_013257 [Amblyomma americanum]|uniref:Secreted protein n=1 Tax=Amblyomma americanum TaxID=6943 RepID=A0AAQ4E6E8_AMBAM